MLCGRLIARSGSAAFIGGRAVRCAGGGAFRNLPSSPTALHGHGAPSAEPSAAPSGRRRRRLPIAAFYDLDNISPEAHRRSDAREFIAPLIEFGRRVNRNDGRVANSEGGDAEGTKSDEGKSTKRLLGELSIRAEGYGNLSTRTYRSKEASDAEDLSAQEYIPWTGGDDANEGVAQTGRDEKGILRCGVCGAKMTLSKKDRKAGIAPEDKLRRHMKIHSAEQRKRIARMGQTGKRGGNRTKKNGRGGLSPKEFERFQKYKSAMVGLKHGRMTLTKKGEARTAPRNDLFQVLREAGISVKSRDDVDAALIGAADAWMHGVVANSGVDGRDGDGGEGRSRGDIRGVVVVYSKDGDFRPLLDRARKKGFVTVTATDRGHQTPSLMRCSDIVIGPFGQQWDEDGMDDVTPLSSLGIMGEIEDEEDASIRDIPAAPVASMRSSLATSSSSQRNKSTIRAVPVTDRGLEFMRDRRHGSALDDGSDFMGRISEGSASWKLLDLTNDRSEQQTVARAHPSDAKGSEERLSNMLESARGRGLRPSSKRQFERQHLTGAYKSNKRGNSAGKRRSAVHSASNKVEKDNPTILGTKKLTKANLTNAERKSLRPDDKKCYECRECGDQVLHWAQFLDHMRQCAHCTKAKVRRMGRENRRKRFEIFLEVPRAETAEED